MSSALSVFFVSFRQFIFSSEHPVNLPSDIQYERVVSADPQQLCQQIIRLAFLINGIFTGSVFYLSMTQGNIFTVLSRKDFKTATIVWPFPDPYLTFIRRFNSINDLYLMLNLKVEIWDWAHAWQYLSESKEVSNNMISYLTDVPRAKNVKDVMSMFVYVLGLLTLIHLSTTYILIKSILAMKHSKSIRTA